MLSPLARSGWPQVDRKAGVIRTIRAKQRGRKREQIVEVVNISPALESLLDRLQAIRKQDFSFVFPSRNNTQYTDRGFKTLWQRCVLEAIKQKILTSGTRFTFRDLRAFYASKHKRNTGELPDLHANKETTSRVYDRNKEVFRNAN